ncbi:YbdK family carboxylate-amine ligase [Thermodesulfobacteriota bacterium]
MKPLVFQQSAPFTLGVEVELQLLDPITFDLTPQSLPLLDKVPENCKETIKSEFIQSMIEVNTSVCADMRAVENDLDSVCRTFHTLTRATNCLGFASSLHPFALVRDRHVAPGERYHQILDDLQMAGRRLITQALHVHIGMPDAETAVRVCDAIRPYLPLLLALTTSSPYFEGEDSGFQSYRTNIFKTLPRSGIPETLGSWQRFQELILILNQSTLLNGIKELWWDVRPHPTFGTLEIRICDLPSRFDEILAVVALCQTIAVHLTKKTTATANPYREIILNNKWHAARYGLKGTYISAQGGRHNSFSQTIVELLESLHPTATELGVGKYLAPIKRILQQGTSAQRQRSIYEKTGDFKVMIQELQRDFWA